LDTDRDFFAEWRSCWNLKKAHRERSLEEGRRGVDPSLTVGMKGWESWGWREGREREEDHNDSTNDNPMKIADNQSNACNLFDPPY
jgi:hypothetical protein